MDWWCTSSNVPFAMAPPSFCSSRSTLIAHIPVRYPTGSLQLCKSAVLPICLARLAALVPRPRSHLIGYHGVLAANARHRRLVVPAPTPAACDDEDTPAPMRAPMSWVQRLRYVFDIDLNRCPRCGAAMRVLAVITEPRVIAAILEHIDTHAARAAPIASA
jgi:hypothetical protein